MTSLSAIWHNARGNRLCHRGREAEAEQAYLRAAASVPTWGVPHFNLGLLYKRQQRWEESLACCLRATERSPDDQAGWWNLGISATALARWDLARAAWRRCGIELPTAQGPPTGENGITALRLNPRSSGEVVWGIRLDPARARLASIPFRSSGYRFQDIVLHDGAPNGSRWHQGAEVPVFDVLARLEASPLETYELRLDVPASAAFRVLEEVALSLDGAAEDWSTSIRFLCKACSEGRPHTDHDSALAPSTNGLPAALAARDESHAGHILAVWQARTPGVEVRSLQLGRI
jgi:tetratricopeptide (TPR) repeat protein